MAAHQVSLSITNSRSSLRLTSIESVMPSSHLILCCPLLLFIWADVSFRQHHICTQPPSKVYSWASFLRISPACISTEALFLPFRMCTSRNLHLLITQDSAVVSSNVYHCVYFESFPLLSMNLSF